MATVVTVEPCTFVLISTDDLENARRDSATLLETRLDSAVETEVYNDSNLTLDELTFVNYEIGAGSFAKVTGLLTMCSDSAFAFCALHRSLTNSLHARDNHLCIRPAG